MEKVIAFLEELQANNNRDWFQAHKEQYKECLAIFTDFVGHLIHEIARFDSDVSGLSADKCIYRIYRDVRFSNDKSPYKTHFGAYISRGGRKSGYSGYYIQIGVPSEVFPSGHWIAVGDYCCDPRVLQVLREDIAEGEGDFESTLQEAPAFKLDRSNSLVRNPKGFPADTPYSEYIRLKSFCLLRQLDNTFVCDAQFVQQAAQLFATAHPFLTYINRAVAYVHEG